MPNKYIPPPEENMILSILCYKTNFFFWMYISNEQSSTYIKSAIYCLKVYLFNSYFSRFVKFVAEK